MGTFRLTPMGHAAAQLMETGQFGVQSAAAGLANESTTRDRGGK
ncbi:MAG TPA: hypothetical protein VLZ05_24005 [Mycobacterium sp.]|nr:hypothetical protein [Mycobacterium sp.]